MMLSCRFSLVPKSRYLRCFLSCLAVVGAARCGGPTAPSYVPPALSCPAPLNAQSLDGNPAQVTFPAPVVSGGTPPVTTTCTPASGSIFPVGGTTVTCAAVDADQRAAASCAFNVTVAVVPRISATSFLAFGNSITEGKNGNDLNGADLPDNYPEDLRSMLAARYVAQTISMTNKGCGGEVTNGTTLCGAGGVFRLPELLDSLHPLIEEGVNDLANDDSDAVPPMINDLRDMVRDAQARNIQVFLATLLPQRPGGSRANSPDLIPGANDRIRLMAATQGVPVVDLYQGFNGSPDPYIGADGLHPTEQGYQKVAQIFFDVLSAALTVPMHSAPMFDLVRAELPRARWR
jgi:lysophospholipase L1-like esterase